MKPDYLSLQTLALAASEKACNVILDVYHSGDFQAEAKADRSPLTLADRKAHESIVEILQPSNLPILSEEGKDISYSVRKDWEYFWMVDPLDGTKEFLKRNGEFTVNIALIHRNTPVMGVVAVPVTGEVYYGLKGQGAYRKKDGNVVQLMKRDALDLHQKGLRVVASRSHMNPETQNFLERLSHPVLVSAGSSLKFMLIANNEADIYPRFAPTMEWDTAAAHAIVNQVDLSIRDARGTELRYNKETLLNPFFLCFSPSGLPVVALKNLYLRL
jgi:3'(2'), 5'-bisphosphate nucleotidase